MSAPLPVLQSAVNWSNRPQIGWSKSSILRRGLNILSLRGTDCSVLQKPFICRIVCSAVNKVIPDIDTQVVSAIITISFYPNAACLEAELEACAHPAIRRPLRCPLAPVAVIRSAASEQTHIVRRTKRLIVISHVLADESNVRTCDTACVCINIVPNTFFSRRHAQSVSLLDAE